MKKFTKFLFMILFVNMMLYSCSNDDKSKYKYTDLFGTVIQDDLRYFISNGKAVVDGYEGTPTSIIIPSYIVHDDYPDDKIPVEGVGDSAFANCSSLINIEIPNSVTTIASNAFYGCDNLSYNVFDNANYLGNVINPYLVLECAISKDITSCEINSKTITISFGAFADCDKLTNIEIPNSVKVIGEWAFSNCSSLSNIKLTNSLTTIESCAFWGCSSLTNVKIPDTVTTIEHRAFSGCSNLTSIVIPNTVTTIEELVFYNCSYLKSIYYAGTATAWKNIHNYNEFDLSIVYYYSEIQPIEEGNYWYYAADGVTIIKWQKE